MAKIPNKSLLYVLGGGVVLLGGIVYASLAHGMLHLQAHEIYAALTGTPAQPEHQLLLWQFRLPRLLMALLVGMGLALAGVVLQGVSRNHLADPGMLGISSGAGVAVILFMWLGQVRLVGLSWPLLLGMLLCGIAGGLLAALLVYVLAWHQGRLDAQRFLLTGIAVGAGANALSLYITLKMNPADFHTATVWQMGQLLHTDWLHLAVVAPWLLLMVPLVWRKAAVLDVLQLSGDSAVSLGVAVQREKLLLLVPACAAVSACVAVAGNVSFVGLLAPHIARRLVGARHQRLLPASLLAGMLLVAAADYLGKTLFAPAELAVGIVLALLGVPYFIYLLGCASR